MNTNSANSTQSIDCSQLQRTSEGMFDCDQCEGKFKRKDSLIIHIQSIHEGVKYPCNQCNYQATHQANLRKHIQSKHDGVKHVCDQCNYQLNSRDSLNKHKQRTHYISNPSNNTYQRI